MTVAVTRLTPRVMMPQTGPAPGQVLWGEAPRRQPIAPLVLMALVLLLVAAPSAMSSSGRSANPLALMEQNAKATYEMTGVMVETNDLLARIDGHSSRLQPMLKDMLAITAATKGMETKTTKLSQKLGAVGGAVATSRGTLTTVNGKLDTTAQSIGGLRTNVDGSLTTTRGIVSEFGTIDASIEEMRTELNKAITLMARSEPLTRAFAENRTRVAVAGGSSEKFGIPNVAPNNRVMSIVLPMIHVMQEGGTLPTRKDRHKASNFVIDMALKQQVPDGTNVVAIVRPAGGGFGLPGPDYFVNNRVAGF